MSKYSIEQEYGGTIYRSRTEARWAMLFHLADLSFQYEPEGYKLESGWYIPDFWVQDWGCFFEVKPPDVIIEAGYYCDERSQAEDLAHLTNCDVIFGCGNPHVTLKLARIPVDGIPPVHEWLTDRVPSYLVSKVMEHRFDWRPRRAARGEVRPFEHFGHAAWRVLQNARARRETDR
jgi:hypothetical protein